MQKHIAIISASVREGRLSHRVALYMKKYIDAQPECTSEILDLKEYGFPLFNERLVYQKNPSANLLEFTKRFVQADAVIIVTPVYNADFPAALKNIIDVYVTEWSHKVVGVMAITYGTNAPIATTQKVGELLRYLGAVVAPVTGVYTSAGTAFAEDGTPADPEKSAKYVSKLVSEVTWLTDKIRGGAQ